MPSDAEQLLRTSATLETLSAICQEITAHLDTAAVFRTLDRHIHGLLPSRTFAIYLLDSEGELRVAFAVEDGQLLPDEQMTLAYDRAHALQCLAERRELDVVHSPDFATNLSALFAPLVAGDHALGVMTVQAREAQAYGDHERMIFRTLCAYGAIALDNAEAYRRLQEAQLRLAAQEKLAALGALMAGVAHELNTPIGNSLLMASTLQQKSADLDAQLKGGALRRSELQAYVDDAQTACELIMRGLGSAADLVNSFKQVAVDRTTEQRRSFNLEQVCHEVIATMMNRVRAAQHRLDLAVPPTIALDSYPGPFGQVIANFINNALLHAFAPGQCGRMVLAASAPENGRVRIEFRDDGCGIAREHLGRIFDPFFTTKLGRGGSGLGLSICYNIVTSLLGGRIAVFSSASQGTSFVLDLPLRAPQAPA